MNSLWLVSAALFVLTLLTYWQIRSAQYRARFLLIVSLALIAYIDHFSALVLFAVSLLVYRAGRHLRGQPHVGRLFLFLTTPLLVLLSFKYGVPLLWCKWWIPLGLSFFTLKQMHYLIECYRQSLSDHRFFDFLHYLAFFPAFTAGPIERFESFSSQTKLASLERAAVSSGCERILQGVIKKYLIVEQILTPWYSHVTSPGWALLSEPWYVILLTGGVAFLITYLDFSAYTDIALGVARLFGYRLMENFNLPILRANLAEFWRSWHISLSSWIRDYIYFPSLAQFRDTSLALLLSMLAMGMWQGPTLAWICWGLHHGIGLSLLARFQRWATKHRGVQRIRSHWAWQVLGILAVWYYVSVAYVLTFLPGGSHQDADILKSLRLYGRVLTFGLL